MISNIKRYKRFFDSLLTELNNGIRDSRSYGALKFLYDKTSDTNFGVSIVFRLNIKGNLIYDDVGDIVYIGIDGLNCNIEKVGIKNNAFDTIYEVMSRDGFFSFNFVEDILGKYYGQEVKYSDYTEKLKDKLPDILKNKDEISKLDSFVTAQKMIDDTLASGKIIMGVEDGECKKLRNRNLLPLLEVNFTSREVKFHPGGYGGDHYKDGLKSLSFDDASLDSNVYTRAFGKSRVLKYMTDNMVYYYQTLIGKYSEDK